MTSNRRLVGTLLMCTLLSLMVISQTPRSAYAAEPSSQFSGAISLVGPLSVPPELECTASDTVLLIQDGVPWEAGDDPLGADVEELKAQNKAFCMINSVEIGSPDLSQFKEIIIAAAQDQNFYDNLFPSGTIHSDIEDWVEDGGVLSANLADCAEGFGNGGVWADLEVSEPEDCVADASTSYTFVGGVQHVHDFDPGLEPDFIQQNDIADPTSPVITGIFGGANGGTIVDVGFQEDLDFFFFSSHGYFINLPTGTEVILTQPDDDADEGDDPEPVIIKYPFGSGVVIASLATGEYRYVGGFDSDPVTVEKKMLSNEIGFQDALTQPCILREEQPEDPISMNTVRNKNIAKTIHAEKQIFDCVLEQGNIPVVVDVTIIGEIFEDMDTKSIIKKQAQVITCTKDKLDGTVLGCDATTPATNPAVPMRNCSEFLVQHPQEMNTVNKGSIVKTIESQKEVFLCNIGAGAFKKVDIVLFTEIWENLNNLSNPIIKTEFEAMRCVMNVGVAEVETCQFVKVFN